MNNLFKLLTISFLTCIMVSGCSTLSRTFTTVEPNYSPQVNAELDVDLSHKIIARNKTTYLFGFLKVSGGHKYAETDGVHGSWFGRKGTRSRAAVVYEALNGSDYDAIAVPNFNTVKKVGFLHLWETYVTTLTGYGAKVKTVHVEGGDTVVVGTMDEDVAKAKEVARTHSSNINTETLYLFESGSVKAADKNTANSLVDSFCEEIEGDIKSAKTLDDVAIIRRKIDALQAYNRALDRPDTKVSKNIGDLNEDVDSKAAKISKSERRASAGKDAEVEETTSAVAKTVTASTGSTTAAKVTSASAASTSAQLIVSVDPARTNEFTADDYMTSIKSAKYIVDLSKIKDQIISVHNQGKITDGDFNSLMIKINSKSEYFLLETERENISEELENLEIQKNSDAARVMPKLMDAIFEQIRKDKARLKEIDNKLRDLSK